MPSMNASDRSVHKADERYLADPAHGTCHAPNVARDVIRYQGEARRSGRAAFRVKRERIR